jgi:hypothetical protein
MNKMTANQNAKLGALIAKAGQNGSSSAELPGRGVGGGGDWG